MPHHTPHQLQQPPSLQPTPQVPPVPPSQPPPGPEPPQPPQKDSQQPAQQPPPPPAQPPKKPSPQPSPPRQAKRAVVSAPAQRGAASSPCNTSTTPSTHTHTLHVFPLLRDRPELQPHHLHVCGQLDRWCGGMGGLWEPGQLCPPATTIAVPGPQNLPGVICASAHCWGRRLPGLSVTQGIFKGPSPR